ncbi:ribosome maturation factor RimM [Companilactobacillus sp.]|jgi:16S rRNA processing protein RimM|uniref:ribosome maturation factor RimM n=1 Tax=Companilactobacillus sp. TaxID=2767905 RepID=UPI0025C25F9E|nr:ribosome maturation factor RimM [Companilactobacillus sp.]MCH4008055.1 ribosome maturation factor RimM [Companilactobacillus sp.]MCH4051766.1 ribosome maturation factor RimM [Companilactobacillus sp.]MCH4075998.1 ribosome maturation factor RimM [Companilactobacillus sp.]MCH4124573.1 ribosome maturation factor RimM [Companilactobacillus sp.]MCH4132464.1 ribosome maturation factor RimM [Companilactobacillus sp.]
MSDKLYRVGKIVNTHGIKGEVRVVSITDFPKERFKPGSKLIIKTQSGQQEFTVESSRAHKNFILLKFKGYDNINDVEQFKNDQLFTTDEITPKLAEGEFLYSQIVGLTVIDPNLGEIGKITEIMELGPNDVWVVKGPKYDEVLVPYIEDVVKKIDLENKQVTVDIPDGLID